MGSAAIESAAFGRAEPLETHDATVHSDATVHGDAAVRQGVAGRRISDVAIEALLPRPAFKIDESVARQSIAGRRVLVTGAGGSIGSEFAVRSRS